MNANLTWEQAGALALALILGASGLGALARRRPLPRVARTAPLLGEAALVVALYGVWQYIGERVRSQTAGAYERGQQLLDAERYLPLPSELSVNHAIVAHPLLAQAANLYYASMHFAAAIGLLIWLYLRHRDEYAGFRTVLALFTAISFVVSLVPVAPPRLIAGAGFVDTAAHYGQSVYTAMSAVGPNQLSAMPSVHVGWSVLVGAAIIMVATSPWRWLALLHPILTMLVVVATANHYWLDGIVAIGLLALSAGLWWAAREAWRRLSRAAATALPEAQPSTQS